MSVLRLAWCLAFAGGLACTQTTTPTFEIGGLVVERGVGVASATITLYESGADPIEATTRTVFAVTSTDSKGRFVFHPAHSGEFYLEVNKTGYFAESFDGPTADPIDIIGDSVSIDIDHPSTERRF